MTALAADSGPRESGHGWSLGAVARRPRREAAITALRAAFSETNRLCRRAIGWIAAWNVRLQGRRALADWDDRMLRDIGLTPPVFYRDRATPSWW
ncbi:MAG TPA: DUF1127 domain-containing protein [Vicinamibacterales bacterium]|nr:DUF1127 domain-containing protein [Vicinamibacterales bacterium]